MNILFAIPIIAANILCSIVLGVVVFAVCAGIYALANMPLTDRNPYKADRHPPI